MIEGTSLTPCFRDHAGGNEILKGHFPGLKVYGGSKENVAGVTQ